MRSGKGRFSYDALKRLADVLDLECYFGPPREAPAGTFELAGEEFATVPLYEPTASAGPGDVVEGEAITGQLAFRLPWLRRLGVDPAQAALFKVRGDSMAPTIPDQALILVDRAAREPRDRCVYVIRQGDELYVKRLHLGGGNIFIATSDNPRARAFALDAADPAPVLGEVRWTGLSLASARR